MIRGILMYCLTDGQKESEALGYLPLPDAVAAKVKAAVAKRTVARQLSAKPNANPIAGEEKGLNRAS